MDERDLDALRAKALAATPGEWRHTCYMSGTQNVEYPGAKGITFVDQVMAEDGSDICHESDAQTLPFINIDHRAEDRGNDAAPQRTRNAEFIAAANPATVLSLLDAIAALRAHTEAAEANVDALIEQRDQEHARAEQAEADAERYERAIRWALGEIDEFPDWPATVTITGNPKYWWRSELLRRAAIDSARSQGLG